MRVKKAPSASKRVGLCKPTKFGVNQIRHHNKLTKPSLQSQQPSLQRPQLANKVNLAANGPSTKTMGEVVGPPSEHGTNADARSKWPHA